MTKVSDFFKLLFDPGENTVFGKDIFSVKPINAYDSCYYDREFFTINPVKHHRRDANVTAHRNFLVEIDYMPLEEQMQYILGIGLPYSTVTYSGGKSFHFIISLTEPVSAEEYKSLYKRILEHATKADKACGNPSRFSRTPGATRASTGAYQSLHYVGNRITKEELESVIGKEGPKPEFTPRTKLKTSMNGFTLYFLAFGAKPGEWNRQLFMSVCDMVRCGYDQEHIMKCLLGITGILDATDHRTIESAISIASKEL